MAKKINPVKEAVERAGGIRKVAEACGISTQAVHQWIAAGRIGSLRRALLLADMADCSVKDLAGKS
jgi:DNA-binding transcriptional regulator YdaS (Cro superfamily)